MIYKEYCKFQYGYDKTNRLYNIIPKEHIVPPSSFYKYYALTDLNVDALTNMYVFATHPNQFNDPFDCNGKLIKFDTWDDVKHLLGEQFGKFKKIHFSLESACEFCQEAYWNILYKSLGLVSLATRNDKYQMWALYAQNNGFCVEFDVEKLPFQHFGPFPINYTKAIPGPIHIGEFGGHIAMLIQTNIKNEWWSYEDEWRLYIPNPIGFDLKYYGGEYEMSKYNCGDEHDRKFRYPIDALLGITLGPKFFDKLVPNPISLDEMDVVCYPNIESNEYKILDFLSRITEKVQLDIKVAHLAGFSHFDFIPISVVKYADNKYRIANL